MSRPATRSQPKPTRDMKSSITYDCSICMTINTSELLELPCGHNLCLSCLHMICTHSALTCPFCRCRISTWLRHNPDYSKLIIQREIAVTPSPKRQGRPLKRLAVKEQQPERHHETPKPQPIVAEKSNVAADRLLAKKIHYEQMEEFRYSYGRITRSMAKKMVH